MNAKSYQENRPFFHRSWIELEKLADAGLEDISQTQRILSELKYRKSRKAAALYAKLAARLESLVTKENQYFRWPTTAVIGDSTAALNVAHFDYEEGLLKFMGYAVGQKGAYRTRRLQVLDYVFNERVPKVQSYEHMAEWGTPKSSRRLEKLANCLASFARNAKRRKSNDMAEAIKDWEEDLNYLKEKYYFGRYDFRWPCTSSLSL